MYHYDFSIAGLLFRVHSYFALGDLRDMTNFEMEYCPEKIPDAEYTLQSLPQDWTVRGECILADRRNTVYHWQGEEHRYFYWNVFSKDRFVLLRSRLDDPRSCSIYLQTEDIKRIMPQFRLSAFLSPERVLLRNKAIILHSSVIDWNGQGILFTAPSGVGKSTQADLWNRLEGAQILNGDRAIIRYQNGQFLVYGSPYAGTSGIYVNRSVPICAIVALSQGSENVLEPLHPLLAFRHLYRECTVCGWNEGFADNLSDLLTELIGSVPTYSLACRPDEGSVAILKSEITK